MLRPLLPANDIMAGKEAAPAQQEIRISLYGRYFELVKASLATQWRCEYDGTEEVLTVYVTHLHFSYVWTVFSPLKRSVISLLPNLKGNKERA
jgi:hypothetical protein